MDNLIKPDLVAPENQDHWRPAPNKNCFRRIRISASIRIPPMKATCVWRTLWMQRSGFSEAVRVRRRGANDLVPGATRIRLIRLS